MSYRLSILTSTLSYKDAACANALVPITGAQAFGTYLTHASAQEFWFPYQNASAMVAAAGKDLVSESIPYKGLILHRMTEY